MAADIAGSVRDVIRQLSVGVAAVCESYDAEEHAKLLSNARQSKVRRVNPKRCYSMASNV
jgi:hypothetical protein